MPEIEKTGTTVSSSPGISYRTWLVIIILVAIAIRLWGLDWGLPQVYHPDEPLPVTTAIYSVATNDWNPHAFHWPSLQTYILDFEYKLWYWYGIFTDSWSMGNEDVPPADGFIAYSMRAPAGFYYIGRLTTLLFGAGIIWLVYILAARFMKREHALFAAALAAFHPILARHSRFVTPDIPAEFFFLACLYFTDRLFTALNHHSSDVDNKPANDPVKWGILASIMVGLGTGTKYPVAILVVPIAAVVLFTPSTLRTLSRIKLAFRFVVASIITFFLTTPFAIIDWRTFLHDILTIGWHVRTGHIGMEAEGGIWLASLSTLINDCSWTWTIAAIVGACLFFSRFKRTWPMLIAFIFVLGGLAPLDVYSDRYLVPVIPFLILGIAWLLDVVTDSARTWIKMTVPLALTLTACIDAFFTLGSHYIIALLIKYLGLLAALLGSLTLASRVIRKINVAGTLLTIIFIGSTAGYGTSVLVTDAYRLNLPDTREFALLWIKENIPPQSVIVKEQGGPDVFFISLDDPEPADFEPLLPDPWYYGREVSPLFARGGLYRDPLDTLLITLPDWVITSSRVRSRYMRESAVEEFPGLVAVFREYYRLIDNYMVEEARFSPGDGITGEEIVIYRVPDGLWESIRIDEVSVEEVLGEEESPDPENSD